MAGHKLSNAEIERLPTLCTLSPGGRISYSEVIAFHNIIRGMLSSNGKKSVDSDKYVLLEMDMVERYVLPNNGNG